MSNKGVGIAFKLTALVLLLGILGVSIGVLIVTLNVQDDVKVVATTEVPTEDPLKNIPSGPVIDKSDRRFSKFQDISSLYEKWMDVKVDPCNDFYHYVCGKGQKSKQQSPFLISQNKDNQVEADMWKQPAKYWTDAPLPVKQVKWFRDKCYTDDSYTVADQEAKIKTMLQQYIDNTPAVIVPWFKPNDALTMSKNDFSKLVGFAKGQFGAFPLLTNFASNDFKEPDTKYTFYIDQPLPIFFPDVYTDEAYPKKKPELAKDVSDDIKEAARILGIKLTDASVTAMANDVVDFDRVISRTMQQDPIVRRQTERNYNPHTLADLNTKADQFDWVTYIQSALALLGNKVTVDDKWSVIIMEEEITLNKLNAHIKNSAPVTVANYVFFRTFSHILGSVPAPPKAQKPALATAKYRAELNLDKRTLTGMLRKPEPKADSGRRSMICGKLIELFLPWPATRIYVDTDHPDQESRASIKKNVAEIANWIFFGFRSQLDQLNWMDDTSKQGAFNKLNNIQLNVAYPDWVTDNAQITEYYKNLDIAEKDNFMNQVLKLNNFFAMNEVRPFVEPITRDRGDFSSFIGVTNAWYQPQMNSITFPEGILQEPFYNPDYPLAAIFGGLGSISGHELTHGFDDQGVQWDGIGALNAWMTKDSQTSFDAMAKCVVDEYSSFCPYPGVCVNGANTQGENIADNGGIQAAYKALKAYESLNGADPRLPGFGSVFTSDQLFFLTFAQTWCDQDQNEESYKTQIKTDVHSPALYRVLGTIQNFPAFKNAFNCPANTPYTPDKHCNVWTSKPF